MQQKRMRFLKKKYLLLKALLNSLEVNLTEIDEIKE